MELLMKLISIESVSGDEGEVREILASEIKKYVKDVHVDNFGNLVAHKKGKKPSILLAAHMDEVGLMVKKILKEGKIVISAIGGIESVSLLGERVKIKTKSGHINGIITVDEMQNGYELKEIPEIRD